ncbi:MAG: hypothetical protein M1834_001213 [Cirrosporium novae-zelandiae]|nr:MAG: hypothetical protein M1834_001213 [Cirrosporium novae-zelandiae]
MAASRDFDVPFSGANALNNQRLHCHPSAECLLLPCLNSPENPKGSIPHVPGEPDIDLKANEVHKFLIRELDNPILDELCPRLERFYRNSGSNIDPLHRQIMIGRQVVLTEDPKFHLVWCHNKIYLKPIPICLFNYYFWAQYLSSIKPSMSATSNAENGIDGPGAEYFDRGIALGFLRSYAFLIQHHSDLILARKYHLVPDNIEWIKWSAFISKIRRIEDAQVAKWYSYGQLCRWHLILASPIFWPQSRATAYWSPDSWIQWVKGAWVFVFSVISIVLSYMQVALAYR